MVAAEAIANTDRLPIQGSELSRDNLQEILEHVLRLIGLGQTR